MLTLADKGGRRGGEVLTMADKGGTPPFLADIICEQPRDNLCEGVYL